MSRTKTLGRTMSDSNTLDADQIEQISNKELADRVRSKDVTEDAKEKLYEQLRDRLGHDIAAMEFVMFGAVPQTTVDRYELDVSDKDITKP